MSLLAWDPFFLFILGTVGLIFWAGAWYPLLKIIFRNGLDIEKLLALMSTVSDEDKVAIYQRNCVGYCIVGHACTIWSGQFQVHSLSEILTFSCPCGQRYFIHVNLKTGAATLLDSEPPRIPGLVINVEFLGMLCSGIGSGLMERFELTHDFPGRKTIIRNSTVAQSMVSIEKWARELNMDPRSQLQLEREKTKRALRLFTAIVDTLGSWKAMDIWCHAQTPGILLTLAKTGMKELGWPEDRAPYPFSGREKHGSCRSIEASTWGTCLQVAITNADGHADRSRTNGDLGWWTLRQEVISAVRTRLKESGTSLDFFKVEDEQKPAPRPSRPNKQQRKQRTRVHDGQTRPFDR